YGLAPAGMGADKTSNFVRGDPHTVAAAMSKGGYLAVQVLPGSFDSFDFLTSWLSKWYESLHPLECLCATHNAVYQLPIMNEWPQKYSILVLDNCRIHHNDALLEIIAANSCFLLF
ncbi:hypothetical protein B0H17DRAFT_836477, partial [Mycena rosella]